MLTHEYAKSIAELFLDEREEKGNILNERLCALRNLHQIAYSYQKEGFLPELVEAFFVKKAGFICKAKSKAELTEILKPSQPHFNGNHIVPDNSIYYSEEEELLLWSRTSLLAPLIDVGYERYKELFYKLLPEKAKSIWEKWQYVYTA